MPVQQHPDIQRIYQETDTIKEFFEYLARTKQISEVFYSKLDLMILDWKTTTNRELLRNFKA